MRRLQVNRINFIGINRAGIIRFPILLIITLLWFARLSQAQTCTGSLGDPVVNITFGTGSGVGGPLANTTYNYFSGECPTDGEYTIVNRSTACFQSTWHALPEDHTPGDLNGYMMLINADLQPGDFFKQTVSVCPNTTYEFAAWLVNVLVSGPLACNGSGTDPELTFTIETPSGILLKRFNTGPIPETASPQWKPYASLFATPDGVTEVVIRITNNAPGGCGNDLALDDITFRACGPDVKVSRPEASPVLCEGQNGVINLNALISPGYNDPAFQWQILDDQLVWIDVPGATSLNFSTTINAAIVEGYQYRFAVAERPNINSPGCRIYSDAFVVKVTPKPVANAGIDLVTVEGQPVSIQAVSSELNVIYRWSPETYLDNPAILNPVATPVEDITYTLYISTTEGCNFTVSDQVFVRVYKNLVINNTFSPNGDNINDTWNIVALDTYPLSDITIYNRYGDVVFHSVGYAFPWDGNHDGKTVPVGTYYFIIDLRNGETPFKGPLTVIR